LGRLGGIRGAGKAAWSLFFCFCCGVPLSLLLRGLEVVKTAEFLFLLVGGKRFGNGGGPFLHLGGESMGVYFLEKGMFVCEISRSTIFFIRAFTRSVFFVLFFLFSDRSGWLDEVVSIVFLSFFSLKELRYFFDVSSLKEACIFSVIYGE